MQVAVQKKLSDRPWNPEDPVSWETECKKVANRNLWISIPALLLAFAVWQIWSVVAVNLNAIGFSFTTEELFTLAALPGLTGATLRIFYSFVVPIFGGRNWTIISTASLLIPAIGIGMAVQDPSTSFLEMAILSALCGFGGGNFSSSMANISFFFPQKMKGTALGLNAGLGNLGVSAIQFIGPLFIASGVFGFLGGEPQTITTDGVARTVWLQNAAYVWVVPIVLTTIAAMFGMNNLPGIQSSVREQLVVLKRKHMWVMTWLYTMCFGSFIGYSAAFPLLIKSQFPEINPLHYAFLGPLVGAIVRPLGGWLADKYGGARVTSLDIIAMIAATAGVIFCLGQQNFWGFFLMFMVLFVTTGIANGSTFRMVPVIFSNPKEAAPVLGLTAAFAAYGAFFIPKAFGWSIQLTNSPNAALYGFILYYLISFAINWYYYDRKHAEVKC